MKKTVKTACGILALCTAFGFCGCKGKGDPNTIKLTVWVSEADRAFAQSVVEEFKAKMIKEAGMDDAVLKLKSLETFEKVADGQATKIIIPSDIQNMAGLAAGIKEVLK